MDQVIEFFRELFSVTDWPPRWHCGKWSEFHGWLYIGSDIAIWLAYFIIPVILIWFIQRRPNIPFLPVFWLFGAFIVLCGTTHLLDAVIFWWPGYRVSALTRALTAIVSFATVFALIRDIPKLLKVADFDGSKEMDKLKRENRAKDLEIARLKSHIDSRN